MAKRVIKKKQLNFLRQQLKYAKEQGVLSAGKSEEFLALYQAKAGPNFISIVLIVGAALVGLGILSFVASNWAVLPTPIKLGIIFGGIVGVNSASYLLRDSLPHTSQALRYLSLLVFGAGIFLIGQIFHLGGHFSQAFLLWSLGTLPTAWLFKDKIALIFAQSLFIVYVLALVSHNQYAWAAFLVPMFYYLNKSFNYSKLITFFSNLTLLASVMNVALVLNVDALLLAFIFFGIGLVFYFMPSAAVPNKIIYKIQGALVFGITGLVLTIPDIWSDFTAGLAVTDSAASIAFAVLLVVFLFYLTKQEDLLSLGFICATIFRYYVDTMYDFMPKSLFFISSGLLLLAFGFYIERTRRQRGGIFNE